MWKVGLKMEVIWKERGREWRMKRLEMVTS